MRAFSNFMSVLSFSLEPTHPHEKSTASTTACVRDFDFLVSIFFLLAGGLSGKCIFGDFLCLD